MIFRLIFRKAGFCDREKAAGRTLGGPISFTVIGLSARAVT